MDCITTIKTAAPLERLIGFSAFGHDGSIDVVWNPAPAYEGQTVNLIYRRTDLTDSFTDGIDPQAIRGAGTYTLTGLVAGVTYTIWGRVETDDRYSSWQGVVIDATEGAIGNLTQLIHNGEDVEHLGEPVLVPLN